MKYGSSDFNLFVVDGNDLLPSKLQSFTQKIEAVQERTDGLGDRQEAMSPTGLSKLTIAQAGAFFDDRAHGTHELFKALPPIVRTVMYSFTGGRSVSTVTGVYVESYAVVAQQGRLTKANVTYQVNGAIADGGALLQGPTPHGAQWSTITEGHPIDLGGPATNGGVVTVQVVALTGIASLATNVQQSDDNVSYVTLGSLDPITAVGTFSKAFPGPIKRYLAVVFAFPETSGTVTLIATFKPNP